MSSDPPDKPSEQPAIPPSIELAWGLREPGSRGPKLRRRARRWVALAPAGRAPVSSGCPAARLANGSADVSEGRSPRLIPL